MSVQIVWHLLIKFVIWYTDTENSGGSLFIIKTMANIVISGFQIFLDISNRPTKRKKR